jgi:hypothetical protein
VIDAPKIKAIESSFGDRPKMKRLLRETNDRGYKIVPSAAGPYFLPCFVEFGWGVSQRTLPECWLDAIFVLTFESLRRISFALWERLVS